MTVYCNIFTYTAIPANKNIIASNGQDLIIVINYSTIENTKYLPQVICKQKKRKN